MFPSFPFSISYFHFSQFSIPDTIQINQSNLVVPSRPREVRDNRKQQLAAELARRIVLVGAGSAGETVTENKEAKELVPPKVGGWVATPFSPGRD